MKLYTTVISIIFSFLLISCNESLDQTKITDENPNKVGEYFFNMFKNNNQEEFNKWVYDPKDSEDFWGLTQYFPKSGFGVYRKNTEKPYPWNTSEFEKCVITQKKDYNQNLTDEYILDIYFNNKEDNHRYSMNFTLKKVEEKNDGKYYISKTWIKSEKN
ncbi:MAG: hypothetical protein ACKO7P_00360 [Bacteroidota bacterium]